MTNRVTPYEAGWLTFLVNAGLASQTDAREAMNRVAQAAIDDLERRARKKRSGKRRKDR